MGRPTVHVRRARRQSRVIAPRATYADTLRVFAGYPTNNTYPKFNVQEIDGVYRLVWQGVHNYDVNRPGVSLPIEDGISNIFLLRVE